MSAQNEVWPLGFSDGMTPNRIPARSNLIRSGRLSPATPLAYDPDILVAVEFEWDPEKDRANQKKHGVSFSEASTVFGDPFHRTFADPRHSIGEFRFLTTGYTSAGRLVILAHADRGDRVRIITARAAIANERRSYESAN